MRITSKGQVTIPIEVREILDLRPGDEIEIVADVDAGRAVIRKSNTGPTRGMRAVDRLRGSGTANLGMSTDELMALMRGD
jgi:AbrB family looped-hinge helix DNA binding protein